MTGTRLTVAGSRGLTHLGARGAGINGSFSQTTNAAGGEVFTSAGTINQNSFPGIVNSGMYKGQ